MSAATAPVVTAGLDEATYRATPGLSATSMKHLLRSPKHYRHMVDHPAAKPEFDLGHAVHAKVLGVGLPIVVIPDDLLASNGAVSTKAAKDFVAEARAAGQIPVKADALAQVDEAAEAVLRHQKASALLALPGDVELSIFAEDPATGVPLRGRLDKAAEMLDGRFVVVDLKTTSDVRERNVARTVRDFGYDIQSEAYRLLLRLALDAATAPTHLVFVEVDPPHDVRVVQLAHEDWIEGGRRRMRRAIDIYARCVATGQWPGLDDSPGAADVLVPPPYYLDDIDALEATA